MHPVTARVKSRQALEPRASTTRPAAPGKPMATPRPATPPAAKHVETEVAPKRTASSAPAVRKTPIPETDELPPPPAAPAKRPRPR